MKEFNTRKGDPIEFTIDGEKFLAASVIPGDALIQSARLFESTTAGEQATCIITFLDMVLKPESAQRFADRFRSSESPIDLMTAADVVTYLVEKLQDRPTGPTSASQSQPALSGNGSGAGVSPTPVDPQLSFS